MSGQEDLKRAKPTLSITSGGAEGSDYEWCLVAVQHQLPVEIMSFSGHACYAPPGCSVRQLSPDELKGADKTLALVAKSLRRAMPRTRYTRNLLRRNMFIVQEVEAVYAIGELFGSDVGGGTAWGCAAHVLLRPTLNLFFYDMKTDTWMTRDKTAGWIAKLPPSPYTYTSCALIGSRVLSVKGKAEMSRLFES